MRSLCLWTLLVFEQRIIMVFLCVCVCEQHLCVCVCVCILLMCIRATGCSCRFLYVRSHVIARMRVTPVSDVFKFGSSF